MLMPTLFMTGISASATSVDSSQQVSSDVLIDPDVSNALKTSDEVNVIITLNDFETAELDSSQKRADLSDDQDAIIEDADLPGNETKSYDRIPAISSKVDRVQLEALKSDPSIKSISISNYYTPQSLSNKESTFTRPALDEAVDLIDANDAWLDSPSHTGDGKKIVIIDTGVDASHPFLEGSVVTQLCFAEGPNGPGGAGSCPNGLDTQTGTGAGVQCTANSSCGHGTHVAGIAAGRRAVAGAPIGGIAPDADIVAIQVFSTFTNSNLNYQNQPMCTSVGTSSPCVLTSDSDVMDALDYVLANRTNVASINMSLGGGLYSSTCDVYSPYQASTINQLRTYGIITVAASGNDGNSSNVSWPACLSGAVAVGATTKAGAVASYSNSNSQIDFWATGSSITSSLPLSPDIYDGNSNASASAYGVKSGTSMATPMIAGAIAVLRQTYPAESANQILTRLQISGVNITDSRNGVTKKRPSIIQAIQADVPNYTELVRTPSNSTVYLLNGSSKYVVDNIWLYLDYLNLGPLRFVSQDYVDGFISGGVLPGVVGSTVNSDVFLISSGSKLRFGSCGIAQDFGVSCSPVLRFPPEQLTKFSDGPAVSLLAKSNIDSSVFYVKDGKKNPIASMVDLFALNVGTSITVAGSSLLSSIPTGDVVVTGGSLIKTADSATVWAVNNWSSSPSVFPVASFNQTIDLGLGFNIKIVSNSRLAQYSVGSVLSSKMKCGSNTYIGTNGVLYRVDPSLYTHFGYSAGSFQTGGEICSRFTISPTQMSRFILNNGTIFLVENGTKRGFTSYAAYLANGGGSTPVIPVSSSFSVSIPTGPAITS